MRIYLDNNATTPLHPRVVQAITTALEQEFGNASSVHYEGRKARQALEEARESVAALIHADPREIVFTSGGTESNNAAIYGALLSTPPTGSGSGEGYALVTTAIEHPSVLEPARAMARSGCTVRFVEPGVDGVAPASSMVSAIGPATRMVSMMLANNETGALQPVEEVGRLCRDRRIHFHCDAVQAAGKVDLDPAALGADSLAISAHKLHGPKGIGALWVRRGTALHPLITGGAQERRRRAGTENVPLAVGFGVAAAMVLESGIPQVAPLRDRLEREILSFFPEALVNSGSVPRIGNTTNICFQGADAEAIVIAMDLGGVALSTGSACSSGRVEPSHVLLAMRLSEEDARSSVRISLSRFTTEDEVERAVALFREIVPRNRRTAGASSSMTDPQTIPLSLPEAG
jgi:cysteine desulfurase